VDDTLTLFLPKYACKINSDWIITITAGVFALACVKLMTCLYTRFHCGFHQGSVPEAWKAYWYRNLIWEVVCGYESDIFSSRLRVKPRSVFCAICQSGPDVNKKHITYTYHWHKIVWLYAIWCGEESRILRFQKLLHHSWRL
jgi:hypothetical protein